MHPIIGVFTFGAASTRFLFIILMVFVSLLEDRFCGRVDRFIRWHRMTLENREPGFTVYNAQTRQRIPKFPYTHAFPRTTTYLIYPKTNAFSFCFCFRVCVCVSYYLSSVCVYRSRVKLCARTSPSPVYAYTHRILINLY